MANKKAVPDPGRSLMDFDKFRYAWTRVGGLLMHALVSTDPVPPDARAVVLVHGCGLSGRYMVATASVLTGDLRVYVPDLPGFGDSDKLEEIFNVPELADWLVSWMRAIGLNVQRFLVISSDAKSSPIWPRAIRIGSSRRSFKVLQRLPMNAPGFGNSYGAREPALQSTLVG